MWNMICRYTQKEGTMAVQKDKQKQPQATPAEQANAKATDAEPVKGKDPNLYDPVGMAGKKAGIVKEILEQEAGDPSQPRQRPRTRK